MKLLTALKTAELLRQERKAYKPDGITVAITGKVSPWEIIQTDIRSCARILPGAENPAGAYISELRLTQEQVTRLMDFIVHAQTDTALTFSCGEISTTL